MTALFDMDGTLFAGDSQLRFCRWILKRHGWRRLYLLWLIPMGILRGLHLINTQRMKRAFLAYAWGMKKDLLQQECQQFVQQEILQILYPPVLERLRDHQAAGDTTVLCSASPDWWTRLVGKALGFTHTIGTPTALAERVELMPAIPAPGNNKGANKLVRLAAIGITHADIGYTDSAADLPMLTICDKAVLVNPKSSFAARVDGAEILTPEKHIRPLSFTLGCLLGL
ncbi:MAG: haloacid dehalogenase-like hydrolase [Akkermansia sp.]|nr:haloacid dehalogenase-like hydrolase [Akkermansia sp.]